MKTKVFLVPNMADTWCWKNPPIVNVCSECGAPAELGGEPWFEWWQHYITCSNLNCSKHFKKIESGTSPIDDIIKIWNEKNPEKPPVDWYQLSKDNNWTVHCRLCGKKVFEEPRDYFMVQDKIWEQIVINSNNHLSETDLICRECAEKLYGRPFTSEDFTDAPVNFYYDNKGNEHKLGLYDKIIKTWEMFKKEIITYLDKKGVACSDLDDKISFNEFDFDKDGNMSIYHLEKVIYNNLSYDQIFKIIKSFYGD